MQVAPLERKSTHQAQRALKPRRLLLHMRVRFQWLCLRRRQRCRRLGAAWLQHPLQPSFQLSNVSLSKHIGWQGRII